MKITKCDIGGCGEDAYNTVDICSGFVTNDFKGKEYKPFELVRDHQVSKHDLCEKHYKIWCKATYIAFWKVKE